MCELDVRKHEKTSREHQENENDIKKRVNFQARVASVYIN